MTASVVLAPGTSAVHHSHGQMVPHPKAKPLPSKLSTFGGISHTHCQSCTQPFTHRKAFIRVRDMRYIDLLNRITQQYGNKSSLTTEEDPAPDIGIYRRIDIAPMWLLRCSDPAASNLCLLICCSSGSKCCLLKAQAIAKPVLLRSYTGIVKSRDLVLSLSPELETCGSQFKRYNHPYTTQTQSSDCH